MEDGISAVKLISISFAGKPNAERCAVDNELNNWSRNITAQRPAPKERFPYRHAAIDHTLILLHEDGEVCGYVCSDVMYSAEETARQVLSCRRPTCLQGIVRIAVPG